MSVDDVAGRLAGVRITGAKSLPFQPTQPQDLPYGGRTGDRYLYRVFDHNSNGSTNSLWAQSPDVTRDEPDSTEDIFARSNAETASSMLYRHLNWVPDNPADNLISWTSSLLFALRYASYRCARHGTSLHSIRLCVVDTSEFPDHTFMRDLDLIAAFAMHNDRLQDLYRLRARQHRQYSGVYYFGEYLSQGALFLRDRCSIVTYHNIINAGLETLAPDLLQVSLGDRLWANDVIKSRECWYLNARTGTSPSHTSTEEITAAEGIGKLFTPDLQLPIMLAMLALRPRNDLDDGIMTHFTSPAYRDFVSQELAPSETKSIDCSGKLPEVRQFSKLISMVYTRCLTRQARLEGHKVKRKLQTITDDLGDANVPDIGISTQLDADVEGLRKELKAIQALTDNLLQLCDQSRQNAGPSSR